MLRSAKARLQEIWRGGVAKKHAYVKRSKLGVLGSNGRPERFFLFSISVFNSAALSHKVEQAFLAVACDF